MGWKDTIQDDTSPSGGSWRDSITDEQQTPKVSELASAGRGLVQGASMGFADEATGALEAAVDWIQNDPGSFVENYKKHRDESRQAYETAEQANPKSYMAGQFGGAVGTALIPGMGGASLGKLALQGGMQGLGSSEADLTEGDVGGAALDTAIGTGIGLAGGAAAKQIAGMAGKAAPAVKNLAEEAATNPTLTKIGNATDVIGHTKGVANKLANIAMKMPEMPELAKKAIDFGGGVVGRKLAYSNPLTGTAQGISDAAKATQLAGKGVAESLENMIPRMGKYSSVLQQALARGSDSLASTHFVLQQTDPEYSKTYLENAGQKSDREE